MAPPSRAPPSSFVSMGRARSDSHGDYSPKKRTEAKMMIISNGAGNNSNWMGKPVVINKYRRRLQIKRERYAASQPEMEVRALLHDLF